MTKYKRIIPVEIEFYYEPEEKATEFEPGVVEEFEITSFKIDNKELVFYIESGVDEAIYKYLKGNVDE